MTNRKVIPFSERRRSARKEIEVPVLLLSKGQEIPGTTKNLSLLGGYIRTEGFVVPGEPLRIRFLVDPPFEVEGKVIWLDQEGGKVCGLGIGFFPLKPGEEQALERLLSR